MALKAGRVGVRKDQVDVNGIINISNVPTELPEYDSTDAGKILAVDNTGKLEFENVPTELPSYSSSDNGKVLSVDSSGELEFTTPSSGSSWPNTIENVATLSNIPNPYVATHNGFIGITGYGGGTGFRLVIEDNTDTNLKIRASTDVTTSGDYAGVWMPMIEGHKYHCYIINGQSSDMNNYNVRIIY